MNDPHRELVEKGYDRVAKQYLATKDPQDPLALSALEEMARDLPPGAAVLDLGCGAGVPATRWLAARGFTVTGVDFSERQLGLARKLVPDATFVKADPMCKFSREPRARRSAGAAARPAGTSTHTRCGRGSCVTSGK